MSNGIDAYRNSIDVSLSKHIEREGLTFGICKNQHFPVYQATWAHAKMLLHDVLGNITKPCAKLAQELQE